MAVFKALEPEDPRQLGRHRILARLGAGGMGQVYLAHSPGKRLLAIKVVRPELAGNGEFRRRFGREVAAARRVNGVFTAGVVDAEPDGSPPWLATVYVPGLSLEEAITGHGPWPTRSVLALGAGLAEALDAVHAAGIVHRDLKPSNVLLAVDGPRVIDFGISAASEASALTRTGVTIGTPGFMSPEQLTGRPVGPASDVFALGTVLAYAATGTSPFGTGAPHALHYRAVHEEPQLALLSTELRTVVAPCLAKPPDQRPTLAALLDQLTTAVAADGPAGEGSAATVLLAEPGWMPDQVARLVREHTVTALPPTLSTPPATTQPDATAQARGPVPPRTARSRHGYRPVALGAALVLVLGSGVYLLKEQPWSSAAQTHSAVRPGCEGGDPAVSWTTVGSTTTCSSSGTTVRKLEDWNGHIAEHNGELRFRVTDRAFPSRYRLSVDVTALTEADPTAEAGCAGFATHTDAMGTTFEEMSVCSASGDTGKFALIKVLNGAEIDRVEKPLPLGGGPFTVTADVATSAVTLSVRARGGESSSLHTIPVASTTHHVGLNVFWKTAGASATFSNFRYQPR